MEKSNIRSLLLYFAWFCAACATAGSLFFSEVMALPPCVLCWYQRIAMYPLVVILRIQLFEDDVAKIYGLPFGNTGLLIAIYHNLLYYKLIPQNIIPCTSGVSCTSKQIEWLGFITIPFLSLVAFALVIGALSFYKKSNEQVS